MKKSKAFLHSLGHSLLVLVYISGVAWLMFNINHWLGKQADNSFLAPVCFLMLFVFSATVMGALVLGRPVLMYLHGEKKAALEFFAYTLLWLAVMTAVAFIAFLKLH